MLQRDCQYRINLVYRLNPYAARPDIDDAFGNGANLGILILDKDSQFILDILWGIESPVSQPLPDRPDRSAAGS